MPLMRENKKNKRHPDWVASVMFLYPYANGYLFDDLSGGGAAVGVGGNYDVHTVNGLCTLLTG